MAHDPRQWTDPFPPGRIPYGVQLQKVFPPPMRTKAEQRAFLIKVYVVLRMGTDGKAAAFGRMVDAIAAARSFCGIFVHEVSEVYVDDLGAYCELVCYLRSGSEAMLLRLDEVASASPSLAGAFQQSGADRAAVRTLLLAIRKGATLEQAAASLPEDAPADAEAPAPEAPPPQGPNEGGGYIIGNPDAGRAVVVRGPVARKLRDAHDRTVKEE